MIDILKEEGFSGYPLHLASAMRPLPPLSIFQMLLSVYPEGAQQPESKWAMLPLHFVANMDQQGKHKDINYVQVVETLISAFPSACSVQENFQGRTPLHLAAACTAHSIDGMIPSTSHAVIETLMATDPSDRFQTPSDLLAALNQRPATSSKMREKRTAGPVKMVSSKNDEVATLPQIEVETKENRRGAVQRKSRSGSRQSSTMKLFDFCNMKPKR